MAVKPSSMENENELVSPTGEIFHTPSFGICIHVVSELDKPVDISHAKKAIQEILLPRGPRFSSIVTKNEKGELQWQTTEVNIDDHVFVPEFPSGHTVYDKFVEDYVSDMHTRKLPCSRPLWEFHFLNYKTTTAESTVIINLHHMLGDGVSLMSLVIACSTKVDNPTLPPSFTISSQQKKPPGHEIHESSYTAWLGLNFLNRIWRLLFTLLAVMYCTLYDLIASFLLLTWMEDSRFPIRGPPGVEMLPKVMASANFLLQDVRKIKNFVGGSVNDVILGVVFCGFRRYCEMVLPDPNQIENLRVTAIALMNSRSQPGLKNLEEMTKPRTKTPWGNRWGFLQLAVPMEGFENPLEYILRAKRMQERKKMSLAVSITNKVISYITRFRGPKVTAKALYNTLANTTFNITTMNGPSEKMKVAGYEVRSGYFSVSGIPQVKQHKNASDHNEGLCGCKQAF
ncbi:wax ester synthase/diacylglycerol acyltransferase 11 isoform X2 [Cryptomeria japonica]|uniref:wax ester synthase/diacylglycerol acyltransferase 11 isoform X2 n=1 Tax=Cryptomeria japonica TaxID=3369 RepID=UPI0027DA3392|nr:wax ester synthase/diacylglycerol acyltransferase 11 isoform X2 [Cryptomeria japonica]